MSFKWVWNKKKKNGTGAIITAKNDVFIFLLGWHDFGGRESKVGGEEVNEQIFGWWGALPFP